MDTMNIYDISRLAGVSRKTVQRVLNGATNVKPDTVARIRSIMEHHHFEPNAAARKLSSSKPTTVGIFIVQDVRRYKLYTDDLFYGAVIGGIISCSNSKGYNVLVSIIDISNADELLSMYRKRSVDAGIIISWSNVQAIADRVAEAGFPIAVFDQNNVQTPAANVLFPYLDNCRSAYDAACYLLDLGHKHLGFVTGDRSIPCSDQRLEGFLEAVRERGLTVASDDIMGGRFVERSGEEAIEIWLRENRLPEAIFCSNDLTAYGALQALAKHRIAVPDRVSVLGFDDLLVSQYTHPPLTSMKVPRVEMAVSVTLSLIERLEGATVPPSEPSSFRAAITERDSCRRASPSE
ncbi:LacI family DNA-binding transcriptional regulator [Cohnella boryungensis]|uniref:LacI family DNA-binding transcriptional regulator n=2 Tax=Cohnella boryungensis TaxID=768479 RepID=A0ABV8SH62_9BACL